MSLVTRGRGSGTDEEAGRRGSGTDEEAGQRRGSGTGPILLSQATFLLAHIANSGPVPLSLSPKPKTFKSRSRITHPSVAESEPTALMTERSKCLWWLYSRMASVQSHQRIKLCRGIAMVLSPRKAGAIPKSGDFDSSIRSLPGTTCDTSVENPRSTFNFAGKIHLPTTVSGESSVSENPAPDALEK